MPVGAWLNGRGFGAASVRVTFRTVGLQTPYHTGLKQFVGFCFIRAFPRGLGFTEQNTKKVFSFFSV